MLGSRIPTNTNFYINSYLESNESSITGTFSIQRILAIDELPAFNKSQLLYYINRLTNIQRLCIPLSIALDILAIAHKESHLNFYCCYKIIALF